VEKGEKEGIKRRKSKEGREGKEEKEGREEEPAIGEESIRL
jgi:hypothetical protein